MHNQYSRQRYLRHFMTLAGACITTGLAAQTSPTDTSTGNVREDDEDVYLLSPFEVTTSRDTGYIATETLAGTRIRTDLKDVASAISVVTKEFMDDVGATDNSSLLQYMVGADVAGSRGTYSGQSMTDQTANDTTPISVRQRIRALSEADGTRDYFLSNIPWDSFNIDRVDIQRGPNSILFGLGSPSGIINAGLRNAQYANSGNVEARYGSFGSIRGSIDVNRTLIDNVLAVRVDGLWSDQKYQQKPAFKDDHRIYVTGRWDPKIFGPNFETSIKVKAEKGKIDANMPRMSPPYDNITRWFDPNSDAYRLTVGGTVDGVTYPTIFDLGTSPSNTNSWYTTAIGEKQQVAYLIDGISGTPLGGIAGYIHGGFLNSNGTKRSYSEGAVGIVDAWVMYTLNNYANYAQNEQLEHYASGQYKNMMLSDPSVFNFYDKLIDGNNKGETADWTTYNIDISQQLWGDRAGINLNYNYEEYNTNDWSVLGGSPAINVDITNRFQDGKANPNYGRAYISNGSGGSGHWTRTERESMRALIFGELRSSDLFENEFLVKLLGRHRLSLVASKDTYNFETREYNMNASSVAWNQYVSGGSNVDWNYRQPLAVIYLSKSLAGRNGSSGLNLSGVQGDITMKDTNVYLFDSTWTNFNVNPGDPWTRSTDYLKNAYNATATTQASNPDNYVGWSNSRIMTVLNRDEGNGLYTSASRNERVISSYAGTYQGFLWNEAIVPTVGWRYDSVKTRSVDASKDPTNHNYLALDSETFKLPDWESKSINTYKSHSLAGGVVVHINKLIPENWNKYVPLNISLSYNDSSNFQITSARVDVWGAPIANPKGSTKEFGVSLSTKDNRFSFRAVKYTTRIKDATVSTDSSFTGTIMQGMKFRNVFLYKLGAYKWSDREKANATGSTDIFNGEKVTLGTRWWWTPSYVDATGRPVGSIYWSLRGFNPPPSGARLETWAESNAHRDASIDAWNNIQKWLSARHFFDVWNCKVTTEAALCNRSQYETGAIVDADGYLVNPTYDSKLDTNTLQSYGTTTPNGYAITANQESKGYEFELTANITKNWRLAFNAAKTTAMYNDVGGGAMKELYEYLDEQIDGVAGDMRQWDGDFHDGQELRDNWYGSNGFNKSWQVLKLTEGLASSELRKWKFNLITSYDFTEGWLKDFGVGAAYRWQDKVGIGYRIYTDKEGNDAYDLSNPIMGPSESGTDFWVSYKHKITDQVNWKIQLNVSNAFENDGLIPISVEPDGTTWAGFRLKPVMEWTLTNTFTF